ncbi:hypothetical protein [Nocardioides cynanchi]|uniref:hypothetical protein n=1 Tax=Nocardioides cynanchi TaxID=2558918 RepID=UPI0012491296|nr:hypothetical protein [Nocardioides cynanchi]
MRHGLRTTALAVGACALLSGCFGSSSPEPTAQHSRTHASHSTSPSTEATSPATTPATSEPTSAPTTGSTPTLAFFPRSNGPHSHNCFNVTGSTPVDFYYYPVVVTPSTAVTLSKAAVTYADGVQVVGAWVAPAAPVRGTGIVVGATDWSTVTQGTSIQWSQRVSAAGAGLVAGTSYNVFLHLRVYPDALPLATRGVVLTLTDAGGTHDVTWVDHLSFKTAC